MKFEIELKDCDVVIISRPKQEIDAYIVVDGRMIRLFGGLILEGIAEHLFRIARPGDTKNRQPDMGSGGG